MIAGIQQMEHCEVAGEEEAERGTSNKRWEKHFSMVIIAEKWCFCLNYTFFS